jgi:Phosphoribosyl transferase (PRTase)/PELOTA RNA binding domain
MTKVGFSGSYAADVTFLLRPILLETTEVAEKEKLIQSGKRHYSEMLAPEMPPTADYLALYEAALARNGARLANDVASLALTLDLRHPEGREIVLASLARAGTPIGILLARALRRLGRVTAHYSVSIIRDRGVDDVALNHITALHAPRDIIFVDGWTGKGAIATELRSSVPVGINPYLVVIADPAGYANLAATHDDYLIASGLLNGVVSGLVSRSILRPGGAFTDEFHACVLLDSLASHDVSGAFVDRIDALHGYGRPLEDNPGAIFQARRACEAMVKAIMMDTGTLNRNYVKPGIAEATRAMTRRVPDRIYLRNRSDPDVQHLLHLAESKVVPILPLTDTGHYRAVAVIASADQ